MTQILITSRDGNERRVDIDTGDRPTLMEAIRNDGSFDLVAMCGGMLSCSTCHVYVGPDWKEAVEASEPISEEEQELIESSEHYRKGSRLSCQIRLDDRHDGLRVTIAPAD